MPERRVTPRLFALRPLQDTLAFEVLSTPTNCHDTVMLEVLIDTRIMRLRHAGTTDAWIGVEWHELLELLGERV